MKTKSHLFYWVHDTLHSDNITPLQYKTLMQIHDMEPIRQYGYIIHQDELWTVPTNVKKYQKTALEGWKKMDKFTAPGGQSKRPRSDK
jgi:hypothetical protein